MTSAGIKRAVTFRNILYCSLKPLLLFFVLVQSVMAQTVEFNQLELDWIGKHPQISVGIDANWPPVDFIKDGQPKGITSDIIKLIAEQTGIDFIPNPGQGWDDMLNQARAHEIDIVATLAKNSGREKYWDYTTPYFTYPYVITTRKQEDKIVDLKSLSGKTVAIEKDYFLHQDLADNHPSINLLVVENTTQALQAVSREQADAYIGNQTVIFYLMDKQRLTNLKVAADSGFPTGKLHFGIRKDWPELVSIIDKILAKTPVTRLKQIELKWLGLDPLAIENISPVSKLEFSSEEQLWLQQHENLTIGVMENWPPISKVDDDGQPKGIDIDLIEQLNSRLGGRINIVPGPWNTIYQDIQDKKLDLIMGITPREFRKSLMDFSTPYLSVPHVIVARKGSKEFYADEASLDGKVLALEADFVNVSYFHKNFPGVKVKTYKDTLDALEAVSRGDADAYAGSRVVVLYLIEKQLLSNLKIHGLLSKPPTELAIGIRKDAPILTSIIQKSLDDIHPDNIRKIVNKWVPLNQDRQQTEALNLSAEEKQWLINHADLSVGTMDNWPPFNYQDNEGKPRGIGIEIIQAINQKLNVKLKVVPGQWKQIYQDVEQKKLDLIMDITPKPSREQSFNFTSPYLDIPHVIIAGRGKTEYHNEDDLINKTLALEEGFGNVKYFQQNYPDIKLKLYPNTEQALEALSREEVDAYAGNRVVALYLLEKLSITNLKVHGRLKKPGSILAIGTRKDYPILRDILQKALDSIGEAGLRDIKSNWINTSSKNEEIPRLNLTNELKDWLIQHPLIRPGIDSQWQPLEYLDEVGRYQGLSSDYLNYFAQQIGVEVAPPPNIPWSEVLQRLRDKTLDLSPLLIKTQQRSEYLNFTKPYLTFPVVIFNKRGETLLGGISDLAGKKVGLVKGYAIGELIQRDNPDIQQIQFPGTLDGLQALATGKIDAYIDVLSVGAYLIASNGMSNLQVAASTPYQHEFSIGVRKDWPQLVTILNQAIDKLPIQKKNEFLKKWLVVKYQKEIDYTLLFWVMAIALFIYIILALRSREMAKVNAQLTEGRERLALSLESAQLGTFEFRFYQNADTQFNYDESFATHHSLPTQHTFKDVDEFFVHISPDQAQMVRDKLRAYVKGELDHFKVEYQINKNSHWISAEGRIFERDSQGWAQRLIGISQNITERKEAQLAMERSSRFKSQFLANMSHEIRTPMNAIVGLSHLLLTSGLNEKQYGYVNGLQKSAKILLGLIDDILDFSKIEAGHLKIDLIDFNLEELLKDLVDMTSLRLTQENVEFIIDIGEDLPKNLVGDSFRLNQVLSNLVSNAIKFTETGNIVLKVSLQKQTKKQVIVLFSVSDTGIGIEKNNLDTLFDPFIQEDGSTTRKYGGTGLGLSISKQLTQLMGGQLKAESEKGVGSRFFFTLPFRVANKNHNQSLLSPPTTDLRGMRVLLADDNATSLDILTDTLNSLNFKVSSVSSGILAIQTLLQSEDKYDLLLIDWRMPDKDGITTAREIRQTLDPDKMPLIILMTAYGKDAIEMDTENLQLDGILIKPITPSSLFNAIIQAQKSTSSDGATNTSEVASQSLIKPLSGHLVLAEDNPINQQVAVEILKQMGVTVSVCENGIDVMELLEKFIPDLILMDIQMPKMDGYEATRNIRSNRQYDQLPIIAMTANAMKEDIQKSIDAGMQGHISKPVDPELLYQTLCKYLDFQNHGDDVNSATELPLKMQQWPESIPGLNIRRGIKQVGGNERLYQKLLKDFLRNHEHLRKDLYLYIQQGELEQASRAAHTLRGVSGNIGAERLYQVATELDKKLKLVEPVETELLQEFTSAYDELCDGIQLLKNSDIKGQNESQQSDSSDSLNSQAYDLLQSLYNSDANSHSLLDQISSRLESVFGKQNLEDIYTLVEDYEFQQAAETLEQLLKGQNDEY